MKRRSRAIALLVAAGLCAVAAAATARSYAERYRSAFGPLRPVLVAGHELAAHRPIGPDKLDRLAIRRVPRSFVPADALASRDQVLGLAPVARIAPGSYLVGGMLAVPRSQRRVHRLPAGLVPIELRVVGAGAMQPAVGTVDVLVTRPIPGVGARTRVVARGARLMALERNRDAGGVEGDAGDARTSTASLAVKRGEAMALMNAQVAGDPTRLLPAR